MGRNSDCNCLQTCGGKIGHRAAGDFRQDQCQRPRPECFGEPEAFVIEMGDLPRGMQVADMGDQRIEGRAALGFIKPRYGAGIGGISPKAVDGFGREGDKSAVRKAARGRLCCAVCRNHDCLQTKFHRRSRATGNASGGIYPLIQLLAVRESRRYTGAHVGV